MFANILISYRKINLKILVLIKTLYIYIYRAIIFLIKKKRVSSESSTLKSFGIFFTCFRVSTDISPGIFFTTESNGTIKFKYLAY